MGVWVIAEAGLRSGIAMTGLGGEHGEAPLAARARRALVSVTACRLPGIRSALLSIVPPDERAMMATANVASERRALEASDLIQWFPVVSLLALPLA